MYTDRKVIRFLQPVAVCVVLVLGALPGVTLVCQWACTGAAGAATEHATHHQHHSTEAPDTSSDQASVIGAEHSCDHVGTAVTAVTTVTVKVASPVAVDASQLQHEVSPLRAVVTANRGAHSPPGARSAPLPLRI